jgi:hypothetical protein
MSRSETIELTDDEIDSIVDDTGVDRKYIKKSLELERADNRLNRYNRKKNKKRNEIDFSNKIKISKNSILFVQNELFSTPTIPNFATVTDVKSPKNSDDKIVLDTKTKHPPLPEDNNKDYLNKSFTFNLSKDIDLNEINYILNYVGVDSISDIKGESIPTKPMSITNYTHNIDKISYNIHTPSDTIADRIEYKIDRLAMKFKCIERQSNLVAERYHGNFGVNRNSFVILALSISPLLIINSNFIYIILISLLPYFILLLHGLMTGFSEVLTKKPEDRNYIKQKIIK